MKRVLKALIFLVVLVALTGLSGAAYYFHQRLHRQSGAATDERRYRPREPGELGARADRYR